MIEERPLRTIDASAIQWRVASITKAVNQICAEQTFDPPDPLIEVIPLGPQSREAMQRFDAETLEKLEPLVGKVARITTNGAPQYLLAPALGADELRAAARVLHENGLWAEALLLELTGCLRRDAAGETDAVLRSWSERIAQPFGVHHFLGMLAAAQTCHGKVSSKDLGGWSFDRDLGVEEFPDACHGIDDSHSKLDTLNSSMEVPALASQALAVLSDMAGGDLQSAPGQLLQHRAWGIARADLDDDAKAQKKSLAQVGIRIVQTYELGEWTIACKHEALTLPVEAAPRIARYLGMQCANSSNPEFVQACCRFLRTSEDLGSGWTDFLDALCKYGPVPGKWRTPDLLNVFVVWFAQTPPAAHQVAYLADLAWQTCFSQNYEKDVLDTLDSLCRGPENGKHLARSVLVQMALDTRFAEPTRQLAFNLLLAHGVTGELQGPNAARLLPFAARLGVVKSFLDSLSVPRQALEWADAAIKPGVYPYNLSSMHDRVDGSFRRYLEKERILMRATELAKDPVMVKIEWPQLLKECCDFVRGVGFDRPVVELLVELRALKVDTQRDALNALANAAQICKQPEERLEACVLNIAFYGDSNYLPLIHAIEANDSHPPTALKLEAALLLADLHRCNAHIHLAEYKRAADMALRVYESAIWLLAVKPESIKDTGDLNLNVVNYLQETLSQLTKPEVSRLDASSMEHLEVARMATYKLGKSFGHAMSAPARKPMH